MWFAGILRRWFRHTSQYKYNPLLGFLSCLDARGNTALSHHVELQRRDQSNRISVRVGVATLNQTSLVEYEEVGKSK